MKWIYKILGTHTHVRVYMNGALCGGLVFRNEEFRAIYAEASSTSTGIITEFVKEGA